MTPPEILPIHLALDHESEHGNPLHRLPGQLALPAAARGIVVFVSACAAIDDGGAAALKEELLAAGVGTLEMDLLREQECHFADATTHLPRLSQRLLALLGMLRRRMDEQAIPELPVGLMACGDATPLAARVAAIRDRDVRALACRGGLLDLAGVQYLKELRAPLLMLAEDTAGCTNARRAATLIPGHVEVLEVQAGHTPEAVVVGWFRKWLTGPAQAGVRHA